jgi:hypothetical protein
MARSVDEWADRFIEKPVSTTVKVGSILIMIGFIFTAAIWGLQTNFSYWWGQGGAIQQKNSTQNFVAAQAQFLRDLALIHADQQNMRTTQRMIDQFNTAHPNYEGNGSPYDPLAQQLNNYETTLAGQQQGCQATVADYDTAARAYLTADWRDANLPETLDPTTECATP